MGISKSLNTIYQTMYKAYGPQHWWPGETPFEVMIGAILTQNTSWTNVEKAVSNLKTHRWLSPKKLSEIEDVKLAQAIRSAGYFNQKTKKLKNFISFFKEKYQFSIKKMKVPEVYVMRNELLEVNGIGPETADSILLYALEKPVFVIDAYTKRIFSRLGLCNEDISYHDLQNLFMRNLKKDATKFNEYHALIVYHGKYLCKKTKPLCDQCCLSTVCEYGKSTKLTLNDTHLS